MPADLILAVLDRARGALLFNRDLTRAVAVRWRRADGTKAKGVLAPGAVTPLAAEPRAESFAILAAAWA